MDTTQAINLLKQNKFLMNSDIQALELAISILEATANTQAIELDATYRNIIDDLTSDKNGLTSQVSELESQIVVITDEKNKLTNDLTEAETTIDALRLEIEELKKPNTEEIIVE